MYVLAFLLIVILIIIAWFSWATSPFQKLCKCEGMAASYDDRLTWMIREVDWDNARVEKCNRITGIIESPDLGIVQPGVNDADVAGLKSILANHINRLMELKAQLKVVRQEIADLKDLLSIATYDLTPDTAMRLENTIGMLGTQVANIQIEMTRTRGKIKTLEDQVMVVDGEVPFNHYNNYLNVCYSGIPWY
jgi:hypothetical protein